MRIDGPQITGSFSLNGDAVGDLEALVTTSSLNTYTSSMTTTMGHVNTATHSLNTFTSSAITRLNSIEGVSGSYATTGSNLFKGIQTLSGSIIPAVNNTYDLGSVGYNFRHLYLSSASLYIDGTKVLGSTSQELQITTDAGQSFKILEAGSDTITLQSADGNITLATSGGGDVILDPTTGVVALKGTTQVYAGNKIRSSDGNNIVFGDGLTVSGSVTITGFIEAQELRTTYISSSILYRSGSTKFGDELTDTHAFTGSLLVSGTISVPGSGLVSGSVQILNGSGVWSGSAQLPSGVVSGSSQVVSSLPNGTVSGSAQVISLLPSGTVSGSVQVDVMSTTNIARLATTGSNTFNASTQTFIGGAGSSDTLQLNVSGSNGAAVELVLRGGDATTNRRAAVRFYSNQISTSSAQWVLGASMSQSSNDSNFYLYSSGATATITTTQLNYIGINRTDPSFYLDVQSNTANTFYTIAQFENKDYTSGTRSFIRVRSWVNAGGSYSSYFGQGQDGKTYIIANNSARGGDIVIDSGNGNTGVGTSSPLEKLDVRGSILMNQDAALRAGTGQNWIIGQDSGTNVIHLGSAGVANDIRFDSSTGTGLVVIKANGRLGVNTIDPATTFDVNGYMGLRSNNYFYFGHTTSNIGGWTTRMYANGSTHMFNANGFTFNNEGYGSSTWLTINSSGNVGVNVASAGSRFAVSGSNSGSNPLVDLTASGTGTFQRGVRLLNGGMNSGDHIMYAVGRSDNARNMGQTYFYYSGDGSTSNRLSFGLHSVDDVMHVQGNGSVSIGETTSFSSSKLAVNGPVKAGRKIFGWYQVTMPDGVAYFHMKTNMWAGGSPNGNIHYTMSLFTAEFYSYGGYIRTGTLGFHNWSGTMYTVVTTGNAWSSPYVSSDGYVVLVIALGSGSYNGLNVDWNQTYGYPYQDKTVTASSGSNSATGVY